MCVSVEMTPVDDSLHTPCVLKEQILKDTDNDIPCVETKNTASPKRIQDNGTEEISVPFDLIIRNPHLKKDEEFYNILHWNMNGVRARLRDGSFWQALQGHDILCITEFRCPRKEFLRKKDVRQRLKSLGFLYWATHASTANKGYAGVCVISKVPFSYVESGVGDPELDKEGHLVMAHFENFTLVVGYLPNSGKKGELVRLAKRTRFNISLASRLGELRSDYVFVGDLNVILSDDRAQGGLTHTHWQEHPGCHETEISDLNSLIKKSGLTDLQQHEGVQGHTFTCTCQGRPGFSCVLDYVLVSKNLIMTGMVRGYQLLNHLTTSDHVPQ